MFILDWTLTLFSKALPLDVAARIWDGYMLLGELFIMQTSLGILRMFATKLSSWPMEQVGGGGLYFGKP